MIDTAEVFLRVAAAGGLGAVIGIERESRNQLAGMRTHALVAAGAAVFTLAGAYGFSDVHRGPNVDPMRVAAQIASGIGFIGAGAIIRDRGSVRGITTAAALWTSAAVGLAAGAGLWAVAGAGAVITLVVLVLLRPVRTRLLTLTSSRYGFEVEYERGHGTLGPVLDAIADVGGHVDDLTLDDDPDGTRHLGLDVRIHDIDDLREATRLVSEREEVKRCTVHRK
ncbi:MAG TPA: MgtC/SapB family protein [Thermoleophilaceae bacterium]